MSRGYHIDTAAYAANADRKWIDNLLTRRHVSGVERTQRGVSRRISLNAVYTIALTRLLTSEMGVSVDAAATIAERMLGDHERCVHLPHGIEVRLDWERFAAEIDRRLEEASEYVARRPRGRPPAAGRAG